MQETADAAILAAANRAAQASLDLSLSGRTDQIQDLEWVQQVHANAGKIVLTVKGVSPNIVGRVFNIPKRPFRASAKATPTDKRVVMLSPRPSIASGCWLGRAMRISP